jgi:oligogalacturonide transporter
MIYSIFPDIPDIDELVSGQRREGMFSGIFTFMRKLSSAFAIYMISQAIDSAGYVKPVKQVIDGATKLVQQPQSPEFMNILRSVFVFLPIFFLVMSLLGAILYPLTPKIHERLKPLLERRRIHQELPEDRAEEEDLKRKLVYWRRS